MHEAWWAPSLAVVVAHERCTTAAELVWSSVPPGDWVSASPTSRSNAQTLQSAPGPIRSRLAYQAYQLRENAALPRVFALWQPPEQSYHARRAAFGLLTSACLLPFEGRRTRQVCLWSVCFKLVCWVLVML